MTPYKLTDESIQFNSKTLYRIELTEDCKWGKAGTKGGFIETINNLTENAWVSDNAHVFGNAKVYGDAKVFSNAYVFGDAKVFSNAKVYGNARVSSNAKVYGNAQVSGNALVYGNALVSSNAQVSSNALVFGNAHVSSNALVYGNAHVYGDAQVFATAQVFGDAWVSGNAKVEKTSDYITISSLGSLCRTITITFSNKMISAGCFRGTLEELKAAVDKKYQGRGNYYPTIQYIEALFNSIN